MFSQNYAEFMDSGEEYHKCDVSSSHHIRDTKYQHDTTGSVNLDPLIKLIKIFNTTTQL